MQVPVWPLVRRAAALHWPRGDARMARWAVPGRDGKEGFSIPQVPAWPPVRRAAPLRWPRYGDILFSAAVRFPPCPSGGEWCSAGAQSSAPRALAARPAPLQRAPRPLRRAGAQISASCASHGAQAHKSTHSAPLTACGVQRHMPRCPQCGFRLALRAAGGVPRRAKQRAPRPLRRSGA